MGKEGEALKKLDRSTNRKTLSLIPLEIPVLVAVVGVATAHEAATRYLAHLGANHQAAPTPALLAMLTLATLPQRRLTSRARRPAALRISNFRRRTRR